MSWSENDSPYSSGYLPVAPKVESSLEYYIHLGHNINKVYERVIFILEYYIHYSYNINKTYARVILIEGGFNCWHK